MKFLVTTTGTLDPVPFPDLGIVPGLAHPTVDYNLEDDATAEQINRSESVLAAINDGHITVTDEYGNPITKPIDNSDLVNDLRLENGMHLARHTCTVVNTGGTLYLEVEKIGGGDFIVKINGLNVTLNCTTGPGTGGKARVALTAGTDKSNPKENFIYVTDSGGGVGILNASVTQPVGSFAWISIVVVPDVTTFDTTGVYSHQRYTEALSHNGRGGLSYERERIRHQGAKYESGIDQTVVITPNGGAPDNVILTTTAGEVYQLHRQTIPAFSGTPTLFVANHPTGAYTAITDLNQILVDANNDSLVDKVFTLIVWGVASSIVGECKLLINLPNGSYDTDAAALADANNTVSTMVSQEFHQTAFLVCRLVFRHSSAASGTWTNIVDQDLGKDALDFRGILPGFNVHASGVPSTVEFLDSTFRIRDEADITKKVGFQVSGIATGVTRIITLLDKSGSLSLNPHVSAVNPTVDNDGIDTAALGIKFFRGDRWLNTVKKVVYVCIDNSTGAALWILDIVVDAPIYHFFADQLDSPNNADWAVNSLAKAFKDSNNNALTVRQFDDTVEMGVGLIVEIPVWATNIIFDIRSRAETAAASNLDVVPKLYVREMPDNGAVEAWSAGTDMTTITMGTSNEYFQYDSQSIALTALGFVAGRVAQIELTRNSVSGSDNLVDDWDLLEMIVRFS